MATSAGSFAAVTPTCCPAPTPRRASQPASSSAAAASSPHGMRRSANTRPPAAPRRSPCRRRNAGDVGRRGAIVRGCSRRARGWSRDAAAPTDPTAPPRWTTEQYLRLVDEGVLGADDKVELLEGVIVAMPPSNARHASGIVRLSHVLFGAVGDRAVVRIQLGFMAGVYSLPEPDAAVIPGAIEDYDREHPRAALLVAEVSDSSLK